LSLISRPGQPLEPFPQESFFVSRPQAEAFLARKVRALEELGLERILSPRLEELRIEEIPDRAVVRDIRDAKKKPGGLFVPPGDPP